MNIGETKDKVVERLERMTDGVEDKADNLLMKLVAKKHSAAFLLLSYVLVFAVARITAGG